MVTHSVAAAMYGDRTLEMQDGRIVRQVRTPAASPEDVGLRDGSTPTRPPQRRSAALDVGVPIRSSVRALETNIRASSSRGPHA